ncbi:response regulator [Thermosulfurimonas sp. F29]|uniref:response regulator n=1 Tax=Thermosulfurimonas sp. F29 TaxID=2867247 RepID=UPI001C829A6B|nr:response regulator [Thermosulfurimonas sp. F29]MBX6422426.1 response regulator [Thermosulfurimonas sp. F29]
MKKRLLIIEDEGAIREQLGEYLSLLFPEVEIDLVGTLAEARRLYAERHYDLIISDCDLPDGSACKLLKTLPPQIPVIILTGLVDEDLLGEVEEEYRGPLYLLKKPVPLDEITNIVGNHLGGSS